MNIGIAGTHQFNNYRLFYKIVEKIIKKTYSRNINLIVMDNLIKDNNFIGISYMATTFANKKQYKFELIPINFYDFSHPLSQKKEKNGKFINKNAGMIQQKLFLEKCDFFILFHRNEISFQYLIKNANKESITFFEFKLNNKNK